MELEGSYILYNNDELEVNASKSAWCELQIFPLQKICFFAVFHFPKHFGHSSAEE